MQGKSYVVNTEVNYRRSPYDTENTSFASFIVDVRGNTVGSMFTPDMFIPEYTCYIHSAYGHTTVSAPTLVDLSYRIAQELGALPMQD